MEMLDFHMVAIAFVAFIAIIALFNRWSRKYTKKRQTPQNKKIFACGEDIRPSRMNIPQESFYRVFIRSLKIGKLSQWHSGDLTRYLIWVFTGMVLIMIYLLFLWGL
jgi:hypothetical protein